MNDTRCENRANKVGYMWIFFSLLLAVLLSPSAHAQTGRLSAGARLDVLPLSQYSVSESGFNASSDGAFAFGASLSGEIRVVDFFKLGLDLGYFSVKADGASSRDSMFNLGARFTGLYPIAMSGVMTSLNPYGFLSSGYSLYIPSSGDSSHGFWIAGGAGLEMVFGSVGAFAELSYGASMFDSFKYKALDMAFGARLHF